MTEPLVAPHIDLRDFPYMPLEVVRVRDSDLAALSSAEGFRAAVMLWCAAWHQLPASSLPNDDRMLAHLAGFGRDVAGWLVVKDEALRKFIECDDGRLYHPTIADKAKEAWEAKIARRRRTEAARQAKLAQAARDESDRTPTPAETISVTEDVATPVTSSKGEEGKGREGNTKIDNSDSTQSHLLSEPATPAADVAREGFDDFWEGYPSDGRLSQPKAKTRWRRLSAPDRKRAVDGLKGYVEFLKARPDYKVLAADKFLSERRFDKFLEEQKPAATPSKPLYRVEREEPNGQAWENYGRATKRKGYPWVGGAWYFPSEWPPPLDDQREPSAPQLVESIPA